MNSDRLFISELLTVEEMREVCALTGAGMETIYFSIAGNLDRLEDYIGEYLRENFEPAAPRAMTVHGPYLNMDPATWDSMIYEVTMTRFGQAWRAAAALHAQKLVFHTGFQSNVVFIRGWAERAAAFFSDFMRRMDDQYRTEAARPGVLPEVVMENNYDPYPEPLLEVWERVGRDDFGICLDIGHAHCHGLVPAAKWAKVLLPALRHVHIHDNHGSRDESGLRDEHLALGEGTIPLEEVFGILRTKPELTYTIECGTKEEVLRSAQVWKGLMGRGSAS